MPSLSTSEAVASQHVTNGGLTADSIGTETVPAPAGVSGDAVGVGEHLDPSRLPPAQRQLYMRIQQKQHHADKPISDITAKRPCLDYFTVFFRYLSVLFQLIRFCFLHLLNIHISSAMNNETGVEQMFSCLV